MRISRRPIMYALCIAVSLSLVDGASRAKFLAVHRSITTDTDTTATTTNLRIRGGSSDPRLVGPPNAVSDQYNPNLIYSNPEDPQQIVQSQEYAYDDGGAYYPPATTNFGDVNDDPMHETVQAQLDSWKQKQREYAALAQEHSSDPQGRTKLMMSVSRGSRATMFIILLFRALFLYEVADQKHKGLKRMLLVIPVCFLLLGNLAGVVASFTAPTHSSKKRLKAILNCDKLVEVLLILFSFLRLTILPSKYTPREIYVGSIFHSVFFIIQAQAFTKFSWDDNGPLPTTTAMTGAMPSEMPMREPDFQQGVLGPNSEWNQGLPPSQRHNNNQ